MKSDGTDFPNSMNTVNSLNSINDALDAQQKAVDEFRVAISSLAREIDALAVGTTKYGKGLAYASERTATLGEECRNASGSLRQAA